MNSKRIDVREKIINAAMEVFSKYGYTNASVRLIAERAGISKGLVFWYFNSKDELIIEVCKRVLPIDIIKECLHEGIEGSQLLRCLAERYLNKYSSKLMRSLLLHTLAIGDMYPEIRSRLDILCDKLLRRLSRRVFKTDSNEALIKMRIFLGSLLCYTLRSPKNIDKNSYISTVIEILIRS